MAYTPVLVTETELRNSFTPPLTTSNISSSGAVSIIEITETYIQDVYFDGTMPPSSLAKAPALALCMSKIINTNPSISKAHKPVASFTIDNYSVTYEGSNYANDLTNMAHRILLSQDMKARSNYIIKSNG